MRRHGRPRAACSARRSVRSPRRARGALTSAHLRPDRWYPQAPPTTTRPMRAATGALASCRRCRNTERQRKSRGWSPPFTLLSCNPETRVVGFAASRKPDDVVAKDERPGASGDAGAHDLERTAAAWIREFAQDVP